MILGASARALAASAVAAGWSVDAADLFCDLDLLALARRAVMPGRAADREYPWCLADASRRLTPSAPFTYTGAIENHPDLVAAVTAQRPLAGTDADAIRRLRHPHSLAAAVRAAGLGFPETRFDPADLPTDGTFLVKPLAGAGGRGIRVWRGPQPAGTGSRGGDRSAGDAHAAPHDRRPRIWQRRVPGTPISASYVMSPDRGRLFGVSRQLLGRRWCHASGFTWCGAVATRGCGGLPGEPRCIDRLTRLGDVLGQAFGPRGVLGVDLVISPTGGLTVIEVNPRPTASMELFERLGTLSVARAHLAACGFASPQPEPHRDAADAHAGAGTWTKAVLFAARPTAVSEELLATLASTVAPWTEADGGWPSLADIPRPGQTIPVAAPVVTVFARGAAPREALRRLRERTAQVDALLAGHAAPRQPASLRGDASAAAWAATR